MDREIALPFRIDSRGRIATTDDPAVLGRQHLTTFVLTRTGERVMRPDWGTGLHDSLFDQLDSVTGQLLLTQIQDAARGRISRALIQGMSVGIDSVTSELRLTVEFALAVGNGEGVTRSTTITLGGEQ